MNHLLHVFGIQRNAELKLLCEIMMKLHQVFTLNAMSLAVLKTIELLL